MLTRRRNVGLVWRRAFRGDRRGGTGVAFALMMSCFMCFVGAAVDLKRATDIRVIWQDAADLAALAGATRYTDSTQAANAKQVATTYFGATVPSMTTLSYITAESAPTVTTGTGTLSTGQSSYQVTVAATVTISTTFMELWETTMTVGVTATAANPIVTPVFSTAVFSSGDPANPIVLDDDTVYVYPVPMLNGQPQYGTLPSSSQLYEIGRNNPLFPVSATQTFPTMTATQPFAFALRNVTGGLVPYGLDGRCLVPLAPAANAYGVSTNLFEFYPIVIEAPLTVVNPTPSPASYNWFYSAYLALGEAPTQSTNYTYYFAFTIRLSPLACLSLPLLGAPNTTTTYPTTTNCSFQAEIDNAGTATANNPPQTGCFSPTATPGVGYAAMNCEQLGTNKFAVWWNDMGGVTAHLLGYVGDDRKNYTSAFFTVSCANASAITQVVLIN
jgi:Flp pilus assembly protein TadG